MIGKSRSLRLFFCFLIVVTFFMKRPCVTYINSKIITEYCKRATCSCKAQRKLFDNFGLYLMESITHRILSGCVSRNNKAEIQRS